MRWWHALGWLHLAATFYCTLLREGPSELGPVDGNQLLRGDAHVLCGVRKPVSDERTGRQLCDVHDSRPVGGPLSRDLALSADHRIHGLCGPLLVELEIGGDIPVEGLREPRDLRRQIKALQPARNEIEDEDRFGPRQARDG